MMFRPPEFSRVSVSPIHRLIQRARTRIFLTRSLDALAWTTLMAIGAAGAMVLLRRLFSIGFDGIYGLAFLPALAVLGAVGWALYRRPDQETVAALLDQRLGIKDRIATALYALSRPGAGVPEEFARQVIDEASNLAPGLELKKAFPFRLTRAWGWVPPALAVLAVMLVYLKPLDLMGIERARDAKQAMAMDAEETQKALASAVSAIHDLPKSTTDGGTLDHDLQAQSLKDLGSDSLSNPESRRLAAARLSSLSQKLDQAPTRSNCSSRRPPTGSQARCEARITTRLGATWTK